MTFLWNSTTQVRNPRIFFVEIDDADHFLFAVCGYCQMLEPIYNQLGETFKNEDSVRITRINAARPENAIEGRFTQIVLETSNETLDL